MFSPQAYILPYVEQNGLYGQLDLTSAPTSLVIAGVSYSGAKNATAAAQAVGVLQCPSDPADGIVPGSTFGGTNYVANTGSGTVGNGTLVSADGVFYLTSAVRFADMVDGSSHTAAFSERMLGTGLTLNTPTLSSSDAAFYVLELGTGIDVSVPTCATLATGDWYSTREREMDSRQLRQHPLQPFLHAEYEFLRLHEPGAAEGIHGRPQQSPLGRKSAGLRRQRAVHLDDCRSGRMARLVDDRRQRAGRNAMT